MKKQYGTAILLVMVLLVSTLSASAVAQPAEPKEESKLPAEIKIGGVFPIVKRPDAGRDRRDAFLMAVSEINNQSGADRILPEGVKLVRS